MKHQNTTLTATLFALGFIALSSAPKAFAVVPAPDGGYPGGNTAEGQTALLSLTSGGFNTAVGYLSLRSDATGSLNTAVGAGTLLANTADSATAIGAGALLSNTTGVLNTANGAFALFNNTTGAANTANGYQALFSNTTGDHNTASGVAALGNNTTGSLNTANGAGALLSNTTGGNNTANGANALFSNTIGVANTANGVNALQSNTAGGHNTAVGFNALAHNTTGGNNIALGDSAGVELEGNDNIAIGNICLPVDSHTIRIGTDIDQTATFIAGISGVTTGHNDAIPVLIDSGGQLGTASSSRRFKNQIKPMDKASESIMALEPVTFHYNGDKTNRPEFGLIAEEVAKVNPDLVVRDRDGEIYTVRYDAVNAMLLNEFLKEHRKVQKLEAIAAKEEAMIAQQQKEFESTIAQQRKDIEATAARQQKEIQALTASLKQQASEIQRVSAQVESNNRAPKVVVNEP